MNEIAHAIQNIIQDLYRHQITVVLTRPDEQFGDYATNIALQLSKEIGKNPRHIAETIVAQLEHEDVAKAEVAGPGFINITLTDKALLALTTDQSRQTLVGKTILVEYSDPNPFKPLHAGHLYTTLVGDMVARLVENAGAKTIRLSYGGDVGRHVAISMWSIIKFLGGENPDKLHQISDKPTWLGERYVEGTAAFETDERAKVEILGLNKRIYELHTKDDHTSAFAKIYWTCRQWSYDYFEVLYKELQVHPFERVIPESEVTPLGIKTVLEQLEKGVYKNSDGAVVFEGEPFGLHTRVFINSEGLPTYEAKDVGLLLTKWNEYHYDKSYYITGNEQAQYFQVMFKSVEQFLPEAAKGAVSMTHGMVKLQGGVKMSSRKGNIVTALEILEAARAAGKLTGTNPNEDTILAAVKYAFAKNRIGGDIVYDPAESIALEGNSGPYLQYAHARACSIVRKAKVLTDQAIEDLEPGERSLVRKLGMYAETIDLATSELMPHHICTYLYELAQEFNRFYEGNKVIGDSRGSLRLEMVKQYVSTLKNGLNLLGIHAPEQM